MRVSPKTSSFSGNATAQTEKVNYAQEVRNSSGERLRTPTNRRHMIAENHVSEQRISSLKKSHSVDALRLCARS